MAILNIPINGELPAFSQRVTLDDQAWELGFTWNAEARAWYLAISDDLGNPVCVGRRMSPLYPPWLGPGGPRGLLLVDADPYAEQTQLGLGTATRLLYVEDDTNG